MLALFLPNNGLAMPTLHEAHLRNAKHYLDVLWKINHLYLTGREFLKQALIHFDLELGNILIGQSWIKTHFIQNNKVAIVCNEYPNAAAWLLDLRFTPRQRMQWLE